MNTKVVLVGTDPRGVGGGIGAAMSGFRDALIDENLLEELVVSYRPDRRDRHLLMAARAARPMLRAIRRIQERGESAVVYSHAGAGLSLFREASLLWLAKRAGAHTMLQIHSPEIESALASRRSRFAIVRAMAVADTLCVLTPYWRTLIGRHHQGRVAVVPDPFPSVAEDRARKPPRTHRGQRLSVLTMTRLVPGKGVERAIAAVARCREDVHLRVAGTGPQRAALERQVADLGLEDRVEFLGWIAAEDKARALERSDLFLLPSTLDSFGMGFIESAAVGVPSVALRWGAIADIVVHESTGLLVHWNSSDLPGDLARAIDRMADPLFRQRLGNTAQTRANREYSRRAVGQKIREALPRHA